MVTQFNMRPLVVRSGKTGNLLHLHVNGKRNKQETVNMAQDTDSAGTPGECSEFDVSVLTLLRSTSASRSCHLFSQQQRSWWRNSA